MFDFESFFAAALPGLESMHGLVRASYTPIDGQPIIVSGFWQETQLSEQDYQDGRLEINRTYFVVRSKDVSNPQAGDSLLIGSKLFVIDEDGVQDDIDGTFTLTLIAFDSVHETARQRNIQR